MMGLQPEPRIWSIPPSQLQLLEGEVHVWRAWLDLPDVVLEQFTGYLSGDEQQRAGRFRFAHHRRWSIASRGILRAILSHYSSLAPGQFQFQYGPQGKPGLIPSLYCDPLEFNLSHSENLAVYAIAALHPVGIDVEYYREVSSLDSLIQRYFSPQEQNAIARLPPEAKTHAFLQYWTCKEATLKAMGHGLIGLKSVEIRATLETVEAIPRDAACSEPASESPIWQLQLFEPDPKFTAAIAVPPENQQVRFWHWQPSNELI